MKLLLLIIISCLFSYNANAQNNETEIPLAQYITINLEMPQLQRKRDIQIYLPANYNRSNKKYPVIYMQDAQNIYNKGVTKKNCWYVDSLLKTLPDNKQAIIVGIDHAGVNRISEYSPYKSSYGNGDGNAYTEFLVQTLKPYMDSHYRTKADPKHTAIAGSSMGGLISFYAILKYPQVFGTAGIFSPALWINPEIDKFVADTGIPSSSRFFFACGDKEGNENSIVLKMDSLLRGKGLSLSKMPQPLIMQGEEYNEHQWRLEFPLFYAWWVKGL